MCVAEIFNPSSLRDSVILMTTAEHLPRSIPSQRLRGHTGVRKERENLICTNRDRLAGTVPSVSCFSESVPPSPIPLPPLSPIASRRREGQGEGKGQTAGTGTWQEVRRRRYGEGAGWGRPAGGPCPPWCPRRTPRRPTLPGRRCRRPAQPSARVSQVRNAWFAGTRTGPFASLASVWREGRPAGRLPLFVCDDSLNQRSL